MSSFSTFQHEISPSKVSLNFKNKNIKRKIQCCDRFIGCTTHCCIVEILSPRLDWWTEEKERLLNISVLFFSSDSLFSNVFCIHIICKRLNKRTYCGHKSVSDRRWYKGYDTWLCNKILQLMTVWWPQIVEQLLLVNGGTTVWMALPRISVTIY